MRDYLHQARRRVEIESDRLRLRAGLDSGPLDVEEAMESLDDAPRILVLCAGNICRSPMAERYLRTRLEEAGYDDAEVDSAGFSPREDRPSPENAVGVAEEFGVDLSEHRSKQVTAESLDEYDVVLLMDAYNYRLLKRRFGDAVEKTYFFGAFGDDGDFEIPDPNQQDSETFRRVYGTLADAADDLVAALPEP